jgi:hypothetical protein
MTFLDVIRKIIKPEKKLTDKEERVKMIMKNGYTWYQYTRYDRYFKDKEL